MGRRLRLDAEMVRRGLAVSRRDAQTQIEAGRVRVSGAVADKPARLVDPADAVHVVGPAPPFVSRGGEKLDHALEHFRIDVTGLRVLDAGASTGGFTDCLLQRGAREVIALDVGHGQLHERIRSNPAVVVIEGYNVRRLHPDDIGGPVEMVVGDLSFISLRLVIPALLSVLAPGGHFLLLVKPQFEAGRQEVSRGRGVITDPDVHQQVCDRIERALVDAGARVLGWVASPITGASGNREFLVHAIAGGAARAVGSEEEAS